jgi:hypothetical protein
MSTMIDDLPGPQPEESNLQEQPLDPEVDMESVIRPKIVKEEFDNNNNNNGIKRFEKFNQETSILTQIKNEFTIENGLLVCILYITTIPELNELIRSLLKNNSYSHMTITIIKSLMLVLAFILIKKFIL